MRNVMLVLLLTGPAMAQDMPALVTAARAQAGVTVIYDPAYVALTFPGGDVAPERGGLHRCGDPRLPQRLGD